jgi:mitochondrial fission protein ELM1
MVSAEMQNKFDNLNQNDFIEIAQSAAESVMEGKVSEKILVNLSSPDVMIFDPIIIPEYKHITVKYKNGKNILIMIGLD